MILEELNKAIEEAIRFGQKEINAIDSQYANRVMVGVEYEIEFPDEDKLDAINDKMFDFSDLEDQLEALQSQLDTASTTDATTDTDAVNKEYPTVLANELKVAESYKLFTLPQTSVLHNMWVDLEKLLTLGREVYHIMTEGGGSIVTDSLITAIAGDFTTKIDPNALLINNVPLPDTLSGLDLLVEFINNIIDSAQEESPHSALVSKMESISDVSTLFYKIKALKDSDMFNEYKKYISKANPSLLSLNDDEKKKIENDTKQTLTQKYTLSSRDKIQKQITAIQAQIDKKKTRRPSDPVDIMQLYFGDSDQSMKDYGISKDSIGRVYREPSLINGAEVVTKPLPLHDALDVMKKMFQFISDYGATTNKTGLHCNISVKGLEFTFETFNAAKMIILSDEKYITKYFPFRKFVESSFNPGKVPPNALVLLVYYLAKKEYQLGGETIMVNQYDFIDNFIRKNIVRTGVKHQTINMIHASEVLQIEDQRRVEVRFPGDADYHTKFNQIQWFLYRSIQMLLAGFDPDYGRKEYMSMGVDAINKAIKKVPGFQGYTLGSMLKVARDNKDNYDDVAGLTRILTKKESSSSDSIVILYQNRANPNLYIVSNKNSANGTNPYDLIWFDKDSSTHGITSKKFDITKYKAIQIFKGDSALNSAIKKTNSIVGRTVRIEETPDDIEKQL